MRAALLHTPIGDFESLYQEHHRMVRAVVFNLSGANDIDDLVQETFVRIWKNREKFEGRAEARTWIYRIAVNAALDLSRQRGRWKFSPVDPNLSDGKQQEKGSVERDLVAKGLATLSADHRVVLVLQTMEGLSLKEIGMVLEIPEGTVRSRLHYAKEKFLEFLQSQGVDL